MIVLNEPIELPEEYLKNPYTKLAYDKFHFCFGFKLVCGSNTTNKEYPINQLADCILDICIDQDVDEEDKEIAIMEDLYISFECYLLDENTGEGKEQIEYLSKILETGYQYREFASDTLDEMVVAAFQKDDLWTVVDIALKAGIPYPGLFALSTLLPPVSYERFADLDSISEFIEEFESGIVDGMDEINQYEFLALRHLANVYYKLGLVMVAHELVYAKETKEQWGNIEVQVKNFPLGRIIKFPKGYFKNKKDNKGGTE